MYVIRFMGHAEADKYLKGEVLHNDTQWQYLSSSTGFCFLPIGGTSIEEIILAYSWLEGNSSADGADCAIIFECSEGRLRKSKFANCITGYYDTWCWEYSTPEYSSKDLRMVQLCTYSAQDLRNLRMQIYGTADYVTTKMVVNDNLRYAGFNPAWFEIEQELY